MDYEQIEYAKSDGVALLTLNRPERLNAWTPRMSAELAHAIERANADDAVGAVVLTGAGRGFCAGADMEATFQTRIEGDDPGDNTAGGQGGLPEGLDWVELVRGAKPLVAAVNGAAVGIGLTMILPFDVIVASERARFGMLFIKMGLVPELASTHFLVQRMGFGRASEMCLSGRLYGADEAGWPRWPKIFLAAVAEKAAPEWLWGALAPWPVRCWAAAGVLQKALSAAG